MVAALVETDHLPVTTGSYDIFTWANVASKEALAAFLYHKLGTVDGIRRAVTFVSLETRRRTAGPLGGPGERC